MAELELNSVPPGSRSLPPPPPSVHSYQEPASSCLFLSLNRCCWPELGMGRPVMLTLEDKDVKGFTWAIAPALTSLGYLLILLVSIFPFWVRLVNEESHEVFFSGLFENCFHIKCWKPRPLSVHIILGRVFLLSAVILSFLTTFILVSFASQLFPRTRKHNLVSAFISFLTGWPWPYPGRLPSHEGGGTLTVGRSGVCAFLALLLHALEIQNLRMKPTPPQISVQWPYYVLGFAIVLFVVAGAICLFQETTCLSRHRLPNSRSIEETQGVPRLENLESLGGDLSSIQKETLLKEETII
ncbi:transmembrane protein 225B isoform X1 [Neomonachus schauinslandi]|uniref:Transmembrane protein 225B isoform X1 n=1 Tax=Neomonachus schauinslandi TaxID=29088 RepID=A0A2Y9GA72_NEOSC|nr:transmembrane protein 225B isoform X1 [Neomonachus schauinslandi]